MRPRTITVEDLWTIPRVGSPEPSADGAFVIVPVRTHSMETNEGATRLWRVPTAEDPPLALTTAEASSGQPALSPDGRRLAFVRKPGVPKGDGKTKPGPRFPDVPQVYVMDVNGGEAERLTDLPLGAADPRWFPDGGRLAFLVEVFKEAPTPEGTAERVKSREEDPVKAFVTEDRVYRFWDHWLTEGKVHHIFALDLATREMIDLTPGSARWFPLDEPSGSYRIAPDGREIAFSATRSDPPHDPLLFGVFTTPVPEKIASGASVAPASLLIADGAAHAFHPVYSPDGRFIVYGIQREYDFYADRTRLVALERGSGRNTVLTEGWDRSSAGWTFGADSGADPGALFLAAETYGRRALFILDLEKASSEPDRSPPKELLRGGTFTDPRVAARRVFSTLESLREPPEVVSCAIDGSDLRRLTSFTRPSLADIALGPGEEIHFEGAGGRRVQMFVVYPPAEMAGAGGGEKGRLGPDSSPDSSPTLLTAASNRPTTSGHGAGSSSAERSASGGGPGSPGARLPLVQMIHGGPHAASGDQWHWRWNAQAFAAPGYVVAMVNFHGSTGWGQDFAASILGRWGDQPYKDVMAATDLLVQRGDVDPSRMAATGGSYGGYLAAFIASQTDRFACIINHAGVSDLQTQWGSDVTQGRRRAMGGTPWESTEAMDRNNPMRHARGFRSPMLVIHGEKDFRVPHGQALEIYNVLQAMKVPARLICYPDENHWILKPRNSRHWYGEVLGWLERWIGKGVSGAAAPAASKAKHSPAPRG